MVENKVFTPALVPKDEVPPGHLAHGVLLYLVLEQRQMANGKYRAKG
jgi:hypothetical protein